MSWPLSQDYNEAIQNPKLAFADPDLKAGQAVVGARGLPLPRSGNFADVYQVRGADGKDWAVKCFTRPVVGLAERYARVSEALGRAKLPFVVGFTFLAEGIRVGGEWRPAVKMEWVEGLLLNQVARENAGRPVVLAALGQMWVRLCKRLREARIAHADLQHGNVLLVPGARPGAYGLKLIDYDGMHVPALANQPSGELGHPAYQHPARAATRAYSPDLDRFPHLVVLTALKSLEVGGSALWDRHDTGDNLLFSEEDFKKPADSKLMRELWRAENPAVQALVGRLALACGKPIPQTPWVDDIAPEGDPRPLDDDTRKAAAAALGVPLPVAAALPPEPTYGAAQPVVAPPAEPSAGLEVDVELVEDRKPGRKADSKRPAYRPRTGQPEQSNNRVPLIVGGVLLLVGSLVAVVALSGGKQKPDDTAQNPDGAGQNDGGGGAQKDTDPKTAIPNPKGKDSREKEPKAKNPDPSQARPPELKPVGRLQGRERWTVELGTDAPALRLAAGTDSRLLAVTGINIGSFCLDATTGAKLPGSENKILPPIRGAIPLDGGRFVPATAKPDAPIPIWDPRKQQWDDRHLTPIVGIGNVAGSIFVSPNARYLAFAGFAAGDAPAPFKLKDVETDRVVLDLELARGRVLFTADSNRVLVAERSGRCRWFKLPSGDPDGEWTYQKQGTGGLGPVTMSGDGAVVFLEGRLAGRDEFYHLLDGRNGQTVRSFRGPYMSQRGNPLSDDGRLAAFVLRGPGATSSVEVIETATGSVSARLTAPAGKEFLSVDLLPDGRAVCAIVGEPPVGKNSERKQSVVRYDLVPEGTTADPVDTGKPTEWVVTADTGRDAARLHVNPAANLVLVGNPAGGRAAFQFRTGKARTDFTELGEDGVEDVFTLEGGRIATVTQHMDEAQVWNAATGTLLATVAIPEIPKGAGNAKALRAALSPDGKYVAVGRAGVPVADNPEVPLRVFEVATNRQVVSTRWKGGSLNFTSDSKRLLVAEWAGRVRWFDLASGKEDGGWDFGPPPSGRRHLVFGISADGSTVAYRGPAGSKTNESCPGVVNGKTGEVVRRFTRHHPASDVFLSADGRRAVLLLEVAPDSCTFEVVHSATGNPLRTVRVPTGRAVPSFALSPDGDTLVVHDSATDKLYRFVVLGLKSP